MFGGEVEGFELGGEDGFSLIADPADVEVTPVGCLVELDSDGIADYDGALTSGHVTFGKIDTLRHTFQLAWYVTARESVVVEEGDTARTEVFELNLIDIDADHLEVVVAIHAEAVVGHVTEVCRTIDVVHLYAAFLAIKVSSVHLARVRHEDNQTVILACETAQLRIDVTVPLQVLHTGLRFDVIEWVDNQDADATATDGLTCFVQYEGQGIAVGLVLDGTLIVGIELVDGRVDIGAGQYVTDVLVDPTLAPFIELPRHATFLLEGIARELLTELGKMVGDRGVLGREICHTPVMQEGKTQAHLIDKLGFAIARAASHDHVPTGLEGDLTVEVVHVHLGSVLLAIQEELIQLVLNVIDRLNTC